jgi:hypothetical protein
MRITLYAFIFMLNVCNVLSNLECRVTGDALSYCSGITTDASDAHLASMLDILHRPISTYETGDNTCTKNPGMEHDRCIIQQLKMMCTSLNSAYTSTFLIDRSPWADRINRSPSMEQRQFRSSKSTNLVYNGENVEIKGTDRARYCSTGNNPVPKQCMSTCIDIMMGTLNRDADSQFMITSELDPRVLPLNICFNSEIFVQDFMQPRDVSVCSGRKREHRNAIQFTWSCISTESEKCVRMKEWGIGTDAMGMDNNVRVAQSGPEYILMNAVSRLFRHNIFVGVPVPQTTSMAIKPVNDLLQIGGSTSPIPEMYTMTTTLPIAYDDDEYVEIQTVFGNKLNTDSARSNYAKVRFALEEEGLTAAVVHDITLVDGISSSAGVNKPYLLFLYQLYLIAFVLYVIYVSIDELTSRAHY